MRTGLKLRLASFWIGVHYSPYNRRFCINLIPCVTFWIVLKGGFTPEETASGQTTHQIKTNECL
jgi:hypothetical protein